MKLNKTQIVAAVAGVFAIAASVGSTLLTPEQRETILSVLPTVLAVFGL